MKLILNMYHYNDVIHLKLCLAGFGNFNELSPLNWFKDDRPYLFHSFRNKYFNKISLGNMLYFQNELRKFRENAWFSDKYAMKNNLQNKM